MMKAVAVETTPDENVDLTEALAALDLDAVAEVLVEVEDLGLDDMDAIEELDVAAAEPEAAPNESAVLDADALQDLDIKMDRAEAYEEQTSTTTVVDPAGAVVAKVKKAKTATVSKTPAAPRVSTDMSTIEPKFFQLSKTATFADDAALEANKAAVIASTPKQIKIAEKFDNVFRSMAAGRVPSIYTMNAFKLLAMKKTLTSADLVAAYKTQGLGEGTARSQTGQMMALFPALGVAARAGQTLTLDANSTVAEYLASKLPA